jgi:hypothetical protein
MTTHLMFTLAFPFSSPSHFHSHFPMPQLHRKLKRGPLWSQNKVTIVNRHLPIPTLSPNSLPPSYVHSSPNQSGLPPLSSQWACYMEWFDLQGNSLGYASGPIPDMASSSQLILVSPASPCPSAPSPPSYPVPS